ncbi:MAG: hypothetical protein AB1489_11300 [Acidobacteriota bacterium]
MKKTEYNEYRDGVVAVENQTGFFTQCSRCDQVQLELECEDCGGPACAGWYGSCCCCGNDYVVAMID